MLRKPNASVAGIVGLLLLLGGAARANESDDAIHRLASQAREQAKAGDAQGLAKTLDEIVQALTNASRDGMAAANELSTYLATPGVAGPSQDAPPAATPEPAGPSPPQAEPSPVPQPVAPPPPLPPSAPGHSPTPAPVAAPEPSGPSLPPAQGPAAPQPVDPVPLPAPAPAPRPDVPAQASEASAALLELLRRQGDAALGSGDISGARRFYRRGANAGCGACAEALARTFDAEQLRRMGAVGIKPDPAQAEAWRTRARQLDRTHVP